jgi:PIN domain nuclease of toxin-antitoxin system
VILLDTQVVLWLALAPEQISSTAAAAIRKGESAGEPLGISVITLYEIANAIRRGRIQPTLPTPIFLNRIKARFNVLPVSEVIALCAAAFTAPFHGDPMDRLIAATAIIENLVLISADGKIRAAGVCKVLW